jgi:hypothetical protein
MEEVMPPRILYFKEVPEYVLQKYGITISPMAPYNWIRYKGVSMPRRGKRWCGYNLCYSRMGIPGRKLPLLVTTARDVDLFLKQMGMI